VFAVGGMKVPVNTPFSVAAEIQVHLIRGPRTARSDFDVLLTTSIGARVRF
jgi:hypothetical protein